MNETADLMREWAEHGSEDAFARLVARHIDLVHSVAFRKVGGNSGLAADVTQTVFTDLARKARALRAEGSLAGWLHRHTCLTAATALRGELRRRVREQTAATMHAHDDNPDDWSHLAPLLDDAVNALGDSDRRAVVLRFYDRRDLRAIGSALGVGEDAAQKRVARALDKLRDWLAKRGVTSSASALATALGAHSVTAAPLGLAATITSAALATTNAAAAVGGSLTFLEIMTHAKTKFAVGTAIAAVVATPLVWQENTISKVQAENLALATSIESLDSIRGEQEGSARKPGAEEGDDRAAREREELERLRGQVASLRGQLQQARLAWQARLPAVAPTDGDPSTSRAGYVSLQDARDVGAGSGEALFQTLLWAMRTGSTNRILQLGDWSGESGREGAEDMLREMAQLAATRELDNKSKNIGFRVLRQVGLEDGDTALVMDMGEGNETHRTAMRIRRTGNEWRMVMGKHGPSEVKLGEEHLRD